jgi:hypothetical protein
VLSDRALPQSRLTTTAGGAPPTPHRGDHAHLSPQKLIPDGACERSSAEIEVWPPFLDFPSWDASWAPSARKGVAAAATYGDLKVAGVCRRAAGMTIKDEFEG